MKKRRSPSRRLKESYPTVNCKVREALLKKDCFSHYLTYLELRDVFNLFDRDKNGSISVAELKKVMVALNLQTTESAVRKLMKEMDVDGK